MTAAVHIPLNIGVMPVKDPDGTVWVQLQVSTPLNYFVQKIAPELITDKFIRDLMDSLRSAARTAKQSKSGLVLPKMGDPRVK
jgi:hypothetical protein